MMSFPRTLLLTWRPPDGRYAGGEALRKVVARLPAGQVWWASLRACRPDAAFALCPHRAFVPRSLHWRLRDGTLSLLHDDWQAGRLAETIAQWARPFAPEVIWVLPEMGAVAVAQRLRRDFRAPLHATVHDSFENARFVVPRLYAPVYARNVRRLMAEVETVDAVSRELLEDLERRYKPFGRRGLVMRPVASCPPPAEAGLAPWDSRDTASLRRIGICGSTRLSVWQWRGFLGLLSKLPHTFEIVAFADRDSFPAVDSPANVSLCLQDYAPSDEELVRRFQAQGIAAAYLGLWKEPERQFFAQQSLSSKLTTYTAAGRPIIVDGPEDSVAWRLVKQYAAGVLCADDETAALAGLRRLLSDGDAWRQVAAGSARLCQAEFDPAANVEHFKALLCEAGGVEAGGAERNDE